MPETTAPGPAPGDLDVEDMDVVVADLLLQLGVKIREARKAAGLSQEALSARLPVSRAEVGHWENGNADPRVTGLLRVAEALGVPAASLLPDAEPQAPAESPLPEGAFGRIDLPGYRNHTGWVTEENRFGVQMAVVRDWEGCILAEVAMGPGCQFVHLPTPLRRPDPQERAAITAGDPWGRDDYGDDDDLDDGQEEMAF